MLDCIFNQLSDDNHCSFNGGHFNVQFSSYQVFSYYLFCRKWTTIINLMINQLIQLIISQQPVKLTQLVNSKLFKNQLLKNIILEGGNFYIKK